MLLKNPPEGYVPNGFVERRSNGGTKTGARAMFKDVEVTPMEMLRSQSFWVIWSLYFIGAGAGLMVIGSVAGMAKSSLGDSAFLAVALLAVGNAGGRVTAGILSDKIGRKRTLASVFTFQSVLMFMAIPVIGVEQASAPLLVLLATFIGFNYGANLAIFPSITKDFWGMKSFGVNYGILFTAWGMGGFVMSRVSQSLLVETGSFRASFIAAGVMLMVGVLTSMLMTDQKDELRQRVRREAVTKA